MARQRGVAGKLFRDPADVAGGIAFVHMHHHPDTRARDKAVMKALAARGVQTIPNARDGRLYDDKVAQYMALSRWMPDTLIIAVPDAALDIAKSIDYPIISKTSEGAGSHNVRMIHNESQARQEIEQVFGAGLPVHYRQRQRGYVFWQNFCAGNDYDYRVIIIGRQRLMLKRYNRDNRPMASGSGRVEPVNELSGEAAEVMAAADEFFQAEDFRWCGIDLVRGPCGRWLILETTVGWRLRGYVDCRFHGGTRFGGDLWHALIDEIEAGAFAGY